MKLAAAALTAALCVAAVQTAAASPSTRAPSPGAATAAFGRLLHQLYGRFDGYWTCPGPAVLGRVDCLAEVHIGLRRHQVVAAATFSHGVIWLDRVSAQTWTRRWSPFSRHFILRSHEDAPGVVSVNSPAYDWGWLAVGAERVKAGQTVPVSGYDGYVGKGVSRFYIFRCTWQGGLITCRNGLGDAMRYRPHPA